MPVQFFAGFLPLISGVSGRKIADFGSLPVQFMINSENCEIS